MENFIANFNSNNEAVDVNFSLENKEIEANFNLDNKEDLVAQFSLDNEEIEANFDVKNQEFEASFTAYNEPPSVTVNMDYLQSENKPSINDVTLIGNKTLDELGIQEKGDYAYSSEIPSKTSELTNDSDFAYIGDVPTKTSELENDSFFAYISDTPVKTSQLENDSNFAYTKDIPTSVSQLKNDSNFVTNVRVNEVEDIAENAKAIAEGKATGYVFDSVQAMNTWIKTNSSTLKLGDNLYIRAVDVPDYWWDGTSVQQLETQKVDLTNYAKYTDYATQSKGGVVKMWTSTDEDGNIGLNISTEA